MLYETLLRVLKHMLRKVCLITTPHICNPTRIFGRAAAKMDITRALCSFEKWYIIHSVLYHVQLPDNFLVFHRFC